MLSEPRTTTEQQQIVKKLNILQVTVINSLVVPKFVCVCSLMPSPKEIISELNRLLYKFLWNGTDRVTRLSTINDYDKGGLKMIDLDWSLRFA